MKKIFIAVTLFLLCATPCSAAAALPEADQNSVLPKIDGWFNFEARTTHLDTVSGYKGKWCERNYRTDKGVPFRAVWIDGAGQAGWKPKNTPNEKSDGLLGEGATFKSITVGGHAAELDTHPLLGRSLAVKLPGAVLTLESKYATENEITDAAEVLIKKIHP